MPKWITNHHDLLVSLWALAWALGFAMTGNWWSIGTAISMVVFGSTKYLNAWTKWQVRYPDSRAPGLGMLPLPVASCFFIQLDKEGLASALTIASILATAIIAIVLFGYPISPKKQM